jgi:hypothetical protein
VSQATDVRSSGRPNSPSSVVPETSSSTLPWLSDDEASRETVQMNHAPRFHIRGFASWPVAALATARREEAPIYEASAPIAPIAQAASRRRHSNHISQCAACSRPRLRRRVAQLDQTTRIAGCLVAWRAATDLVRGHVVRCQGQWKPRPHLSVRKPPFSLLLFFLPFFFPKAMSSGLKETDFPDWRQWMGHSAGNASNGVSHGLGRGSRPPEPNGCDADSSCTYAVAAVAALAVAVIASSRSDGSSIASCDRA